MPSPRHAAGLAGLLTVAACALAPPALAERDFSLRYGANQPGAIAQAANTLMSCPDLYVDCADARAGRTTGAAANDNAYAMSYVDVDGDARTFDSSRARLTLPPGADVRFAGLYYGARLDAGTRGDDAADPAAAGTVLLRAPGDADYRTLTAALDTSGDRYQGFVDVTRVVRAAGGGDYTVANVQAATGEDRYAGWSLVVAYGDAAQPVRNLSVFDGFQSVSPQRANVAVPVSGFLTPRSGAVRTKIGFVAYEGDRGSAGDGAKLNATPLSDGLKAANNVFDSTISDTGQLVSAKDPDHANQLGFDAFTMQADGILPNGSRNAVIGLSTASPVGDTYLPGVTTFATDLYAPLVRPQKAVVDVNGGAVEPGDELQYTITVPNDGQDGAEQLVVRDAVPDRTTYVANSAQVVAGAGTPQYDATARMVSFPLGEVAPGGQAVVRFRVKLHTTAPAGTAILNRARAAFVSETLGLPLDASSNQVSSVVAAAAPATPPIQQQSDACTRRLLRLVEVMATPRGVVLAGETSPTHAGRTVSLLFAGRPVGEATVREDGTFGATVPLPPRALRNTNRARYQAVLGAQRSLALKLARRMNTTRLESARGMVTISGQVTRPLADPPQTVTLRESADCRGYRARVVKRGIRVSPSGRFTVTVPAPAGERVAYYRALTRVRRSETSPRSYTTFTLVRGVTIDR